MALQQVILCATGRLLKYLRTRHPSDNRIGLSMGDSTIWQDAV